MFLRIWIILFAVFTSYSIYLYCYCDKGKEVVLAHEAFSGRALWQKHNCQSCHQLYGLGGYMGPDLTNIISTSDNKRVFTFIKYGTGKMPDLHLTDSEVNNLIAYLAWINKTGKSMVPKDNVHWTGTYVIE